MDKKHKITLEYCVPWNYWPRAARAADDILSSYQHIVEDFTFITGSKGVFDFKVDGKTLYSKKETGRHAEPGEVLQLFKELVGPDVPTYPKKD